MFKNVKVVNESVRCAILGASKEGARVGEGMVANICKLYFQSTGINMSDTQVAYIKGLSNSQAFHVIKALTK